MSFDQTEIALQSMKQSELLKQIERNSRSGGSSYSGSGRWRVWRNGVAWGIALTLIVEVILLGYLG